MINTMLRKSAEIMTRYTDWAASRLNQRFPRPLLVFTLIDTYNGLFELDEQLTIIGFLHVGK